MVGEEEGTGSRGQCPISSGRKTFWRSASWSSSSAPPGTDGAEKNSSSYRGFPVPLTPRSQQNCKARSCLPPLQPLSITRRSLDEWPNAGSDDVGEWLQPPTPSSKRDASKPGEGLKLDLASFQKGPEQTGTQVKREQIALFDKECSRVADHIYLGGDAVARNRDILRKNGITHVLNCVGFVCPEYFKTDLVYKTLWLQDSPTEDITSILYDVFDYFEDVREQGGRVLVHCCQGVSRSTSLVIAYVMWREGQSFEDAFQYVKAARGITNPNMGFACQLLQCQKRVHAVPLSPSSVLRMYRMAPHSSYDPLHLVPKMLNDPSLLELDSRGAFIVHVPLAIYVWIGKKCNPVMERDAKAAAFQVVRYERVQGPIITIVEGEEPSDFWDVFSKCPLSMDNLDKTAEGNKELVESVTRIEVGKKKVDSYNIDFELFERAITGGVVPAFSSSGVGPETHLPARESGWSILRRKFVCGSMRAAFSRVYSDSVLVKDTNARMNRIQLLSSSPPYLSPSSLSSDSNKSLKFSSESPSLSPSTSLSRTPSPIFSILSDSSVPSSKPPKPLPVSSCPEPSGTMYPSKPSSKGFSLSLAERRGSASRSLKLPALADDSSFVSRRAASVDGQTLGSNFLDIACIKEHVLNREETIQHQMGVCLDELATDSLCHEIGDSIDCSGDLQSNFPYQEGEELFLVDDGLEPLSSKQPTIYRWPDLKKIAALGASDLDSKAAFLLLVPNTGCLGKQKVKLVYLWVGSGFVLGDWQGQLDNSRGKGEVGDICWKQVVCDFLTLFGQPIDIPFKVVKQEEEPAEFLEFLNYFSFDRTSKEPSEPAK